MNAEIGGDIIGKRKYGSINVEDELEYCHDMDDGEEDEFGQCPDIGKYDKKEEKRRKKEKKRRRQIKQDIKKFKASWNHCRRKWEGFVPEELRLALGVSAGIFFGRKNGENEYVGKPDSQDGHVLTVGESGRGKTMSIVVPTIGTWKGIEIIIDVKGNLTGYWKKLNGQKGKRLIVFEPGNPDSCHYDPFLFLRHGGEDNLPGNARDLALALLPLSASATDLVWIQTAQNFLTGVIIYYYDLGASFHDAIIAINDLPVTDIIEKVMASSSASARVYMSKLSGVQDKIISNIGMELSNLAVFAADPNILDVLSVDGGHEVLDWQDILTAQEPEDVILAIPESRLEQWRPMVLLMVNQLTKSLEQRKERTYCLERELPPVLVMLDEFARIGKIPAIKNGLATLRSRGVTFALFIQSLADLTATYGHEDAKSIIGNCPYKVILGVTDAECQRYFSELAGNMDSKHKSVSMNHDGYSGEAVGYSRTISEARRPLIYPEEFSTLKDVVLLTPYGNCRINKIMFYEHEDMFLHSGE